MMPSLVEKTLQVQSGLTRATKRRNSRRLSVRLIRPSPMLGQAGGGLAQEVGPSRKYLGPQNCLFTFVKHLTVATGHKACALYPQLERDAFATLSNMRPFSL